MPSPIYGALRLNSPAVTYPATPQQIAGTHQLLEELTLRAEEVVNTTRSSLQAEKNSVAGHSLTRVSTVIPMVAGFVNDLTGTIDNWNTPGFNRGQNVFALVLWVSAAVYVVIVMWKHHQQIVRTKKKEQNHSQAKALFALQSYLDKSKFMVQACLSPDQNIQKFLPAAFDQFHAYTLKQAKAGAAPNDLVIAWAGAGVIIRLPAEDPGHAGLAEFVQTYISPLMTEYTNQVQKGLADLGIDFSENALPAPLAQPAAQAVVPAPPPPAAGNEIEVDV